MEFEDMHSGEIGVPGGDSARLVSFTAGTTTVTETVAMGHGTQTLTFTQESGNSALYQLTPPEHDDDAGTGTGSGFAFAGIGTASVTETISGSDETTVLTYAQVSGSTSQYQLSGEKVTFTAGSGGPAVTYNFTTTGGSVTAISETITEGSHSKTFSAALVPTASYVASSGSVVETLVIGNTVETLTYSANSGSGGYSLTSTATSFVSQGGATTALDVDPYDRAQFTVAGGAVTAASNVGWGGKVTPIPSNSHVSFTVLATGFIEESFSGEGDHSGFRVYYDGSGGGTYTEIAHGGGTVDLVGLKAQLAQLPSAVAALI